MADKLSAVKGMNDILPPESARWEWFEDKVRALMRRYGYVNVRTPVVEPTALFVRGLGAVTDIVEKEMYSFEDAMNGDRLTLRPEATAGIVRAMRTRIFSSNHSQRADSGGSRSFMPLTARSGSLMSFLVVAARRVPDAATSRRRGRAEALLDVVLDQRLELGGDALPA